MVRLYEARKVVLSSGQMQRRSWKATGFADLDQCLKNLRAYTEVTPEEEEHMRAQLPFVIAEFERQGFITEARLCELFPTFETLKTHVNMDGEGSSRRAGIHTHPHFIARKAAHVAAKKAEEHWKYDPTILYPILSLFYQLVISTCYIHVLQLLPFSNQLDICFINLLYHCFIHVLYHVSTCYIISCPPSSFSCPSSYFVLVSSRRHAFASSSTLLSLLVPLH